MPKLKLLKHGFYSLVSYTLLKCLSRKNWSELLEKHEINFFRSTPSTVVVQLMFSTNFFFCYWRRLHRTCYLGG